MIDKPFKDLVSSFAAKTPTPGGGAAAALAATMGTALLVMVVRFTRGKKSVASHEEELAQAEALLVDHLARLEPMAERDCRSFDAVSKAYGLPKLSPQEQEVRKRAIDEGMIGAMVVPEETLCMVRDVFQAVAAIVEVVGRNIISDLGSGAELLIAAAEGAFYNVRINAAFLSDPGRADASLQQSASVLAEIRDHHRLIRGAVDRSIG